MRGVEILSPSLPTDEKMAVRETEEKLRKGQPASVTFIQGFGGAINLNVHYHFVFLEGVYLDRTDQGLKPRFVKVELKLPSIPPPIAPVRSRQETFDWSA